MSCGYPCAAFYCAMRCVYRNLSESYCKVLDVFQDRKQTTYITFLIMYAWTSQATIFRECSGLARSEKWPGSLPSSIMNPHPMP